MEAGRRLALDGPKVRVRWIRPIESGSQGLTDAQFDDVLRTLAAGYPVAAGSAHSRLLVGYREEPSAAGGGVFVTLDSALASFAEVSAEYVRTQINDAFVVEAAGLDGVSPATRERRAPRCGARGWAPAP